MSWLLDLDRDIFIFINSKMTTPLLDVVMPVATELHKHYEFWIFIALFFAVLILRPTTGAASGPELGSESGAGVTRKSRARAWLTGVLLVGLSMGLADLAAYRGVKVWVKRDRPEAAGVPVVLRTDSHSGWSFPSNHAANNFAMARAIQIVAPVWAIPAYAFAAVVGFSRIYVGVHYPLDVIAGGLIGLLCATLVGVAFEAMRQRLARRLRQRPRTGV